MSELLVLDYTVRGRTSVRSIRGEFSSVRELKLAVADAAGVPPHQQLLLHEDSLVTDEMDDLSFFDHHDEHDLPHVNLHLRLPDDAVLTLTVRCPGERTAECTLRADVPVHQLKDYVARKFCLPQWRQELTAQNATMVDDKAVGCYAVIREMDVLVTSYAGVYPPEPVEVTVRESRTRERTRITVDKRDTLEVLLGYLERAGVLEPTEAGHIYVGNDLQPTGKSFEDTNLRGLLILVKDDTE